MVDYEDGIFSNLPRSRRRPGERDDDDRRLSPRQLLAMNFVPEGPLPERPRPSGKGGSSPSGPHAPVISAAPVVTGAAAVGQTLTCSTGTWLYVPTGYTYQWLRDGVTIAGATSSTYVVVSGDLTHAISCTVTATNATGNASATSNAMTIVALPGNTVAPVISGTTTVGSTLSCTTGTWSGSPTSYAYQWVRGASNISGATSATYVIVSADNGTSLTCVVTASNAAGSASATSNALSIGAPTSVWSAADATANGMTLTNGGLTVTSPAASGWKSIRGTVSHTSGKFYIEFLSSGLDDTFGLASAGFVPTGNLGSSNYSGGVYYNSNTVSAGFTSNYLNLFNPLATNVVSMAVDFGAGSLWVALNNVWVNSSNPATGSLPILSFVPATVGALFPTLSMEDPGDSITLQPTAASQKYAPPAGFSAWDGGAPVHSAQALAYLARTVGGNEGGNGANIATLIDGLVSDGVWAKLDALYVLAQQNQTDALLNLVSTSYPLTGTATFAAYQGFSAFPAGLLTGFIPSSASSPHFTLNSSSIGGWAYNTVATYTGFMVGTTDNQTGVYPSYGAATFYAFSNDVYASFTRSPTAGFYVADGISTTISAYYNGSSVASASTVPVALDTVQVKIGFMNSAWPGTISSAFIGASLGSAGQLALYNRLRTYLTAVGVP